MPIRSRQRERRTSTARRMKKAGGEVKKDTTSSKSNEKKATELLKKKTTKAVNPNYKPLATSGKTRAERDKIRGEGERYLKGVFKDQETIVSTRKKKEREEPRRQR